MSTQGVTLINLGPDEKLAGLQKIVDTDDAGEEWRGSDDEAWTTGRATGAAQPGTNRPEFG